MKTLLIMLLFLSGCYYDGDEVTYKPDVNFQAAFNETVECTGLDGYFPLTLVVDPAYWPFEKYTGYYDPSRRMVLLNGPFGPVKHEYIHHLLYINNDNADSCHKSPLFEKCGDTEIMEKC